MRIERRRGSAVKRRLEPLYGGLKERRCRAAKQTGFHLPVVAYAAAGVRTKRRGKYTCGRLAPVDDLSLRIRSRGRTRRKPRLPKLCLHTDYTAREKDRVGSDRFDANAVRSPVYRFGPNARDVTVTIDGFMEKANSASDTCTDALLTVREAKKESTARLFESSAWATVYLHVRALETQSADLQLGKFAVACSDNGRPSRFGTARWFCKQHQTTSLHNGLPCFYPSAA